MRNIVTIIIATLLLTGLTELHQFLKLPLLISHLRQHQADDPSMSLFDFLYLHYNTSQHPADNDDNEDNELPFKSAGTIHHTDIATSLRKEMQVTVPVFINNTGTINHPEGNTCQRSFSIFHPPRLA